MCEFLFPLKQLEIQANFLLRSNTLYWLGNVEKDFLTYETAFSFPFRRSFWMCPSLAEAQFLPLSHQHVFVWQTGPASTCFSYLPTGLVTSSCARLAKIAHVCAQATSLRVVHFENRDALLRGAESWICFYIDTRFLQGEGWYMLCCRSSLKPISIQSTQFTNQLIILY